LAREILPTMSQRNVELVRRAFEAQQRRDNETVFALYDPEIEIEDDPVVEGRRGIAARMAYVSSFGTDSPCGCCRMSRSRSGSTPGMK
jgi:hypothetical protein